MAKRTVLPKTLLQAVQSTVKNNPKILNFESTQNNSYLNETSAISKRKQSAVAKTVDDDDNNEMRTSVASKKRKIKLNSQKQQTMSVDAKSQDKRPNAFFCFRIMNKQILEMANEIQEKIVKTTPLLSKALISIPTLHITLLVFQIKNEEEKQRAQKSLQDACDQIQSSNISSVQLTFRSLSMFGKNILYIDLDKDSHYERLNQFAEICRVNCEKNGIFPTDTRKFTPHLTLVKLSKAHGNLRKKGIKHIEDTWCTMYKNQHFGVENIESLILCNMMKKQMDGFYEIFSQYNLRYKQSIDLDSSNIADIIVDVPQDKEDDKKKQISDECNNEKLILDTTTNISSILDHDILDEVKLSETFIVDEVENLDQTHKMCNNYSMTEVKVDIDQNLFVEQNTGDNLVITVNEQCDTQPLLNMPLLNKILFPAPNPPHYSSTDHPKNLIWLPAEETTSAIPCYYFVPSNCETSSLFIIWIHGNGCDIGSMYTTLKYYSKAWNAHILEFEYPSYGLCDNSVSPSEQSINAHARRAYSFVHDILGCPSERIVFYGHSIGSGAACYMVSYLIQKQIPVGGLILQSAYKSITDLINEKVRVLRYLFQKSWNNIHEMEIITCPVLMIHGKKDSLIPYRHSEALHAACVSEKKELYLISDADHNSIKDEDVAQRVSKFFTQYLANDSDIFLNIILNEKYYVEPDKKKPLSTGNILSKLFCVSTASINATSSVSAATSHITTRSDINETLNVDKTNL